MWIVRWLVVAIVILLAITFTVQNTEQEITLRILAWQFGPLPVYLALIVAFALGMLAFLLFALFQQLQLAGELARESFEHSLTKKELDRCRGTLNPSSSRPPLVEGAEAPRGETGVTGHDPALPTPALRSRRRAGRALQGTGAHRTAGRSGIYWTRKRRANGYRPGSGQMPVRRPYSLDWP
jgi:uncharacterized integral membrane protein